MIENRRLLVVALAGALVGAGCLGLGTEADEDQNEDVQDPETTAAEEQAAANRTSDTTDANETESIRWTATTFEGRLGVEAVACSMVACAGTFTCAGQAFCQGLVQDPRVERSFPVDHDGPVEEVNLTLAWDALSPVTEELRFGIAWDCDDGCTFEFVEGTAPLSLEASDLGIDGDLSVWVWTPDQSPEGDPVVLHATHDQPFTIEGAVATDLGR